MSGAKQAQRNTHETVRPSHVQDTIAPAVGSSWFPKVGVQATVGEWQRGVLVSAFRKRDLRSVGGPAETVDLLRSQISTHLVFAGS